MKTREELEAIISEGDIEKKLILASVDNNTKFWLQFLDFKLELCEEELVPNINKDFLFRPEIFKFLFKKLDSVEKLIELVFNEEVLNVELVEIIINNFDNHFFPMDYFPKINNKNHYYTIISICEKNKMPARNMYGLMDVINPTILDKELIVNFLKYIAKNASTDSELLDMIMNINVKTLKKGCDATSILYRFDDSEFSEKILKDPEFIEGRKIFTNEEVN
ncbi:MAG: hypothetical protein K0R72_1316 [Clostridia bacterium]|jgi:hypothetical protein|nr:hypothetical protein [Clostridia bacterium]